MPPEPKPEPPSEVWRHIAKSAERVIIAAFTTRNTIPFGLLVALGLLIYRLPGESTERLLTKIIDSRWFATLGWVLLLAFMFFARKLFVWREKLHAAELEQVVKVRDRLVEEQLKLKLDSPALKLESSENKK